MICLIEMTFLIAKMWQKMLDIISDPRETLFKALRLTRRACFCSLTLVKDYRGYCTVKEMQKRCFRHLLRLKTCIWHLLLQRIVTNDGNEIATLYFVRLRTHL